MKQVVWFLLILQLLVSATCQLSECSDAEFITVGTTKYSSLDTSCCLINPLTQPQSLPCIAGTVGRWYKFQVPEDKTVLLDTVLGKSDFTPMVNLYRSNDPDINANISCKDDLLCMATPLPSFTAEVTANATYYILVTTITGSSAGDYKIRLLEPVSILWQIGSLFLFFLVIILALIFAVVLVLVFTFIPLLTLKFRKGNRLKSMKWFL